MKENNSMKENSPMSIPKGWIPLNAINKASNRYNPEVAEMVDPTGRLDVNITLPSWLKSEEIILNLRRLLRMMNLAGMATLGLRTVNDEEPSQSIPTIVGIDASGGALAGKAGFADPERFFSSDKRVRLIEDGVVFHELLWTDVTGRINIQRLLERVSERGDVRDIGLLAQSLDKAVRVIIREEGTRHLLFGHSISERLFAIGMQVYGLLSAVSSTRPLDTYLNITIIPYSLALLATDLLTNLNTRRALNKLRNLNPLLYKYYQKRRKYSEIRHHIFFPGWELDRALVLQIYSRLFPVIKALPIEEKDV